MYTEEDLLQLSGLQHFVFCPRQWALIHIEGIWAENRLTVEGKVLHERTDKSNLEVRGNIRIARALMIRSLQLGLSGKADVVEFHRVSEDQVEETKQDMKLTSIHLKDVPGFWRPVPVEYKRGRPKPDHCDEVQLCAQALCLEEMLSCTICKGYLYYGQPRKRYEIAFDESLREETKSTAEHLHRVFQEHIIPAGHYEKKCDNCSLLSNCMPKAVNTRKSALKFLANVINESISECRETE